MSTTEAPFELSQWQQWKLLDFIDRFDQAYGDGSFDPETDYTDPGLIAMALRASTLLGLQDAGLERFFEHEFGLIGINKGELETMLSLAMLIDAEKRLSCIAGGRN